MLSPAEADELALYFTLVDTPTLRSEIIADFNKPVGARQLSPAVVRSLANKLSRSGGAHPAEFSKIAAANLLGTEVSMIGQVPVDTTAPDVHSSDGMLLVDAAPQQRIWNRIATGELTDEERAEAATWLDNIGRVDLTAIRAEWEPFVQKYLGPARTLSDLIDEVDRLLKNRNPAIQFDLLGTALALVRAPQDLRDLVFQRMLDHRGSTVESLASYAGSVLKLHLSYLAGLVRGFIGPRQTDHVDLQYLFYAPFCMVFASVDRLHRSLWPAASGINSFVWGPDLKRELAERIVIRENMTPEEREAKTKEYGFYPIELSGSIITEVWRKYIRPKEEILPFSNPEKTIDDLEPEIRDMIKAAQRVFRENEEGGTVTGPD
jgi:hypothetical protein